MSNNITGSGISFWQLIAKNKIEIPIIQRDYAQGRDDEKTKKIRNGFLSNIINALEKENSSLELDFVYGNVKNNILQPLDGQQRLTTLFLLHWVLALKTNNLSKNVSTFFEFTYETRISSREFCNGLVKNWDDLGEGETLSEKISDSKWFFLSWKKDPTIKAMLTMLDAIEEKLKDRKTEELNIFWQKLTLENPVITFNFKELNDVGLTDDLYIKMNARGKALTEFENFKAQFEKYIKESNPDKTDWEVECKDKPTETFSHKIDTIWTDLFWKYRGNDNLIDNEFIKFISGIAINNYAQNLEIIEHKDEEGLIRGELEKKSNGKPVSKDAVKRERIERKIQLLFNSPDEISPIDFPTKKAFDYLVSSLDNYSIDANNEILPNNLPLWDYCKKEKIEINSITNIENNLFIEFIKNSETTYKQRVLFYAQTQYLLSSHEFNQESFSDWLRVVRNIVENTPIDSATTFIRAINLIKKLSNRCNDVYDFLSENSIQSKFAEEQVKEEIRKAKLIDNDNKIKAIVFELEDTLFCKGTINWCLECSDKVEELNKIKGIIGSHLSQNNISNLFRRALLTIGNNDFYNYWRTWSYNTNTHKKCLIESRNKLKNSFTKNYWFDNYLKPLIIQLCNNGNDLQIIVDSYTCTEDMPNWKSRLIKKPDLLDNNCQGHYMGITDDNKQCYLYGWKKRPASRDECYLVE